MSLSNRLTVFVLTSFILLSIFTVPLSQRTKAIDEFFDAQDILEIIDVGRQLIDFDNVMDPHPFRFVGLWHSNDTMTIKGDINFDLYFSSTILTQLGFLGLQDSIDISVYHRDKSGFVKKVEGASATMTLDSELSTDFIQNHQIQLSNIDLKLEKDDNLIFAIEMMHSEKPLNEFVQKRFDTKIMGRIEKIVSLLQRIGHSDLENISMIIETVLNNLSDFNIGGREFGALVNVLVSSAFYYGSSSYPSSVKFSTDEGYDVDLYFHNQADYSYDTMFIDLGYIKVVNNTKPIIDTNYAYPPIAVNIAMPNITEIINNLENINISNITEFIEDLENITNMTDDMNIEDEDWVFWLAIWALYIFESPEYIQNRVSYYLHSGGVMDSEKPVEVNPRKDKLSETPTVWIGAPFQRNKILKNVTADLYIYYPQILTLKKTTIAATLKQGDEVIAISEVNLGRTTIIERIKRSAEAPTTFEFGNLNDKEIWYDQDLSLEISVVNKPLGLFKSPVISYDSSQYPSKITFSYEETDNIKLVDSLEDRSAYAGEKIEYKINISSEYDDNLDFTVEEIKSIGDWDYTVYPEKMQINAGENKEIKIIVESKAEDASAYDKNELIQLAIIILGNTGYTRHITTISVSKDAVEYGVGIIVPEDLEIKHGSDGKLKFIVRNTNKGYIADRYIIDIESKNGWGLEYTPYIDKPVGVNEEAELDVILSVPWFTNIKNDELTIRITSYTSQNYGNIYTKIMTVNVAVQGPNIIAIIAIIAVIILSIILVIFIVLKKVKYVDIACLEPVKEIDTDEIAVYDINIKNPYKSSLNYNIQIEMEESKSKSWDVSIDEIQLMIDSKQERNIRLYVKPKDYIKKEDWVEVKVVVKPVNKNKKAELSTVTSIKDSKVDVKISGILHWPRVFNKGDRIETSFKLFNIGSVSADNISIILYVNGEEKNKVENITIPRGGHADITIPWIAVKGKNELYIVVK
jgi:hypothetical protein